MLLERFSGCDWTETFGHFGHEKGDYGDCQRLKRIVKGMGSEYDSLVFDSTMILLAYFGLEATNRRHSSTAARSSNVEEECLRVG